MEHEKVISSKTFREIEHICDAVYNGCAFYGVSTTHQKLKNIAVERAYFDNCSFRSTVVVRDSKTTFVNCGFSDGIIMQPRTVDDLNAWLELDQALLSNVTMLAISNWQQVSDLPVSLNKLKNVTSLNIRGEYQNLADAMKLLPNLRELNINCADVTKWVEIIRALKSLTQLTIEYAIISSVFIKAVFRIRD